MWYGVRYAAMLAGLGAMVWALLGRRWTPPFFVLAAGVLYFFRDPEREVPAETDLVVSPADGKVTAVETCPDGAEFRTRISIFLSLLDVHVTRSPVGGRITDVRHRPGRFHGAMSARSSSENERNEVRIEGTQQPVMLVQIAGFIARRVVFWSSPGEWVQRGQRVGLIKFGSRVDVYLGADAEILVYPGQRLSGGRSVLARLLAPPIAATPHDPALDRHEP